MEVKIVKAGEMALPAHVEPGDEQVARHMRRSLAAARDHLRKALHYASAIKNPELRAALIAELQAKEI